MQAFSPDRAASFANKLVAMRTLVTALAMVVSAQATADDLLPADRPIHEAIDHYIAAGLKKEGIKPAPQADDATLVRRLTLDLAGRIPTMAEAQGFVLSDESDKRDKLVDRLIESPEYVRHQSNEFDAFLMQGVDRSVRDYLQIAFAENRPWDQMFRDLLLVDGNEPSEEEKSVTEFMRSRVSDTDKLTNDASVIFFGVNVSCAKCHDHPLVADWTQDHFYGMKSFFNRTFDNGGFIAEREYGMVDFKTTAGEGKTAQLMFLTGTVVDEPEIEEPSKDEKKQEQDRFNEYKKKKQVPPPPKFSRRAQLAKVAMRPEERRFFSRAIVNRLLLRFFGQGLVMPIDQMHAENEPSHPELLDWLARDFQEHGYDLKRLVRGIVMSEAYSRSSRFDGDDPPGAWHYAVAQVRPLSPYQLGGSIKLASYDPQTFPPETKPEDFQKKIDGIVNSGRFVDDFVEVPDEDFQVSIREALIFSNSDRIERDVLSSGGDRLVKRLTETEDPRELVELCTWTIFSRPPADEEGQHLAEYLDARKDRREQACKQIIWAMMTSSEFRFNH